MRVNGEDGPGLVVGGLDCGGEECRVECKGFGVLKERLESRAVTCARHACASAEGDDDDVVGGGEAYLGE
jgi:hypothetical protein